MVRNSLEKGRHLKKIPGRWLDEPFVYHCLSWANFNQSDQQTIKFPLILSMLKKLSETSVPTAHTEWPGHLLAAGLLPCHLEASHVKWQRSEVSGDREWGWWGAKGGCQVTPPSASLLWLLCVELTCSACVCFFPQVIRKCPQVQMQARVMCQSQWSSELCRM